MLAGLAGPGLDLCWLDWPGRVGPVLAGRGRAGLDPCWLDWPGQDGANMELTRHGANKWSLQDSMK